MISYGGSDLHRVMADPLSLRCSDLMTIGDDSSDAGYTGYAGYAGSGSTCAWEPVEDSGPLALPGYRIHHTMVSVPEIASIIIYGGVYFDTDNHTRFPTNDLFLLVVESASRIFDAERPLRIRWDRIAASGIPPSPSRYNTISCCITAPAACYSSTIAIFGGSER